MFVSSIIVVINVMTPGQVKYFPTSCYNWVNQNESNKNISFCSSITFENCEGYQYNKTLKRTSYNSASWENVLANPVPLFNNGGETTL